MERFVKKKLSICLLLAYQIILWGPDDSQPRKYCVPPFEEQQNQNQDNLLQEPIIELEEDDNNAHDFVHVIVALESNPETMNDNLQRLNQLLRESDLEDESHPLLGILFTVNGRQYTPLLYAITRNNLVLLESIAPYLSPEHIGQETNDDTLSPLEYLEWADAHEPTATTTRAREIFDVILGDTTDEDDTESSSDDDI